MEQGHPAVLTAGQHELPGLVGGQAVDGAGVDLQGGGRAVLLVENILDRQHTVRIVTRKVVTKINTSYGRSSMQKL